MITNQTTAAEIRRLRQIIAHAHQLLAEVEAMAPKPRRIAGRRRLVSSAGLRGQRMLRAAAARRVAAA